MALHLAEVVVKKTFVVYLVECIFLILEKEVIRKSRLLKFKRFPSLSLIERIIVSSIEETGFEWNAAIEDLLRHH